MSDNDGKANNGKISDEARQEVNRSIISNDQAITGLVIHTGHSSKARREAARKKREAEEKAKAEQAKKT
jgi:hypothetical protein